MKYFIDTEFVEGTQSTFWGNTKPTIDLISIGIVAEDGRQYYEISKEFNVKEAWNRYEIKQASGDLRNIYPFGIKEYWLRENVLKPVYNDLIDSDAPNNFCYKEFKKVLNKYGKTNAQIAKEVKLFCSQNTISFKEIGINELSLGSVTTKRAYGEESCKTTPIEFYAYYGDYDWVVFCWLFGRMIDLPEGFPKYCKDLQQIFDEKKSLIKGRMKDQPGFPVNNNIHNALEDAKWNYNLYKFLENLHE